jgi:hypothetical protein
VAAWQEHGTLDLGALPMTWAQQRQAGAPPPNACAAPPVTPPA